MLQVSLLPPIDDSLAERVQSLAPADGVHPTASPGLRIYRFSSPVDCQKQPTLGVTLGTVLRGTKRVTVEGRSVDLGPGQAVLFTRDACARASIVERPYLGLSLRFCPARVAKALLQMAEAGAPSRGEVAPVLTLRRDERVSDALLRLLGTLDDPLERAVLAPLAVDEILFHLLRTDAAAALRAGVDPGEDSERILAAMAYIRERAAGALSVKEVARHVAMSPSHFAHRFREVARTSPMRYARQVRLDQARELLLGGELRIGEIAERAGYLSAAHFTRDFTRQFGLPPTRYRERLGGDGIDTERADDRSDPAQQGSPPHGERDPLPWGRDVCAVRG